MNETEIFARWPQLESIRPLVAGANHVDVKSVEGEASLREFVTRMLGYRPGWLRALFTARRGLAAALRLRQIDAGDQPTFTPETLPFSLGAPVGPGRVVFAEEDRGWATEIDDKHLAAVLAVLVDPSTKDSRTFHLATIVRYRARTGPLYFNLIRPFHHAVVAAMARAGVTTPRA